MITVHLVISKESKQIVQDQSGPKRNSLVRDFFVYGKLFFVMSNLVLIFLTSCVNELTID